MLPTNWLDCTVGDLVTLQRGIDLPDAERLTGQIPIMGSFGITGRHNKAACKGPGVTVGRSGASIGVVSYIDVDYWPLNTCLYVRDFHGNNPRFVYYFLKTLDLARFNSGSAQPSLNRNFVHPVPVCYPARPEQDAIALILGSLDDKIDLNHRTNETLEAMARAIFRDWFVDFGPTQAKMEGRAPYLAPEIWSLFPDRLDNEGRPQGWEWGTLASCTKLNPESWSRSTYPALIEYVDLSGTKWGSIETTEVHDREHAPSRAQRVLRPNDTIVGTVRPGNGSYAFVSKDGLTGSTGFAVLRPRQRDLREFVYLAATAPENIERLSHLADGAAYPAVRPEIVSATEVVIPAEVLTEAFSTITGPLVDRMEANKQEIGTLAATRDLLLPKLMSGEIRVREAEKIAEAAQ